MDEQETIVYDYFVNKGFDTKDIVFETDGRIRGLEDDRIPFCQCIESILPEFDNRIVGKSFFVRLRLKHPLPKLKKAKSLARNILEKFCKSPILNHVEIDTNNNFSLIFIPATPKKGRTFLYGASIDPDRNIRVISEIGSFFA